MLNKLGFDTLKHLLRKVYNKGYLIKKDGGSFIRQSIFNFCQSYFLPAHYIKTYNLCVDMVCCNPDIMVTLAQQSRRKRDRVVVITKSKKIKKTVCNNIQTKNSKVHTFNE